MTVLLLAAALAAPRPVTGSSMAREVTGLHVTERQAVMVEYLRRGYAPTYLDRMMPVSWTGEDATGVFHSVEIEVMCDYLSVGTDEDFLPVPLNLFSAIEVARERHMVLPTPLFVDAIYAQATERFEPQPMPPDDKMRTVAAYLRHRAKLREQGAMVPTDGLRAGHKKDLVLTPQLEGRSTQVAIYGWHRDEGDPIQGLSLWHGARYTDYSHGVRLVSPVVRVDGVPHDFYELWADETLWPLVSAEGRWLGARDFVDSGPTPLR